MKRTGKIVAQTSELTSMTEHPLVKEDAMERLLKVEQYLNNEVALTVFRKFNVFIRVHI